MRWGSSAALLAVILALSVSSNGQNRKLTMSGVVTDKQSRTPIEGATVSVVGSKANQESTDAEGSFILSFAEGVREGEAVRIHVEKPGYRPYDKLVAVNSTIVLQVSLLAQSQPAIGKKQKNETKPQETKGEESEKESPKVENQSAIKKQPPPLTRQKAFSAVIPFAIDRFHAGIPYDSNTKDPLILTYTVLAGISEISTSPFLDQASGQLVVRQISDAEIEKFLGHVMQYYILRTINEIQNPVTYMNFETGVGTSMNTNSPVSVPDEKEYPSEKLLQLFDKLSLQFSINSGPRDWMWKNYKMKVPSGTKIDFIDVQYTGKTNYVVHFERAPDLLLDFRIEPALRNRGQGTFPKNFAPAPADVTSIQDAYTYVFTIHTDLQWKGDRSVGQDYIEWANGLEAGLHKKLVIP